MNNNQKENNMSNTARDKVKAKLTKAHKTLDKLQAGTITMSKEDLAYLNGYIAAAEELLNP